MRDTAGEVGTNSLVTFSCVSLHMDEQRQDDQLEPIYKSSLLIQDVALKTYRERWTIEKGSGRFFLAVQHDDDDGRKTATILRQESNIQYNKWMICSLKKQIERN